MLTELVVVAVIPSRWFLTPNVITNTKQLSLHKVTLILTFNVNAEFWIYIVHLLRVFRFSVLMSAFNTLTTSLPGCQDTRVIFIHNRIRNYCSNVRKVNRGKCGTLLSWCNKYYTRKTLIIQSIDLFIVPGHN